MNIGYVLTIQDVDVGYVNWVSGGVTKGVIASSPSERGDAFQRKQLSGLMQTPLVIQAGLNLDRHLYDWISDSWSQGLVKRDVGISVVDTLDGQVLFQRKLLDAFISEVTIPACDQVSKKPGQLTITIVPDEIRSDSFGVSTSGLSRMKNNWLVANFRLEIGNLPCDHVARVASFTWKQHAGEQSMVARSTLHTASSSLMIVPELTLNILMGDRVPWEEWHREFVLQGNTNEVSGSLQFLAWNLREDLAKIRMENMGVISFDTQAAVADEDELTTLVQKFGIPERAVDGYGNNEFNLFEVELYCEQMLFEF